MDGEEKLELLVDSLEEWKDKFDNDKKLYSSNRDLVIQKNAMSYMAQWIINSINGDLSKTHPTNICNIILKGDKNDR